MYYYLIQDWDYELTDQIVLKHRRKFTDVELNAELSACEEDTFYPKGRLRNKKIWGMSARFRADELIAKRGFSECVIEAEL